MYWLIWKYGFQGRERVGGCWYFNYIERAK
jgi:hypothetical protein